MLGLRTLLLALSLLALQALAAKITYTGKYHDQGGIVKYSRSDKIEDKHAQPVVQGVEKWSNKKYKASQSKTGIITVYNVKAVGSKKEAVDLVKDMEHLVWKHTVLGSG
ncbi:hypothetical protein K461DRAFT_276621 [Myriangium duriaei CBS 260.36]|uniref:Uncharacterized protein n=1 Tax=Myriangium duriaei CBS 260.36 TaxID=1168546 RepID=A0A9P4J950_9PEZI|nr:hypothetical protein K461DRAFT_276621 [Myriangium duriaei CBS 260.36]